MDFPPTSGPAWRRLLESSTTVPCSQRGFGLEQRIDVAVTEGTSYSGSSPKRPSLRVYVIARERHLGVSSSRLITRAWSTPLSCTGCRHLAGKGSFSLAAPRSPARCAGRTHVPTRNTLAGNGAVGRRIPRSSPAVDYPTIPLQQHEGHYSRARYSMCHAQDLRATTTVPLSSRISLRSSTTPLRRPVFVSPSARMSGSRAMLRKMSIHFFSKGPMESTGRGCRRKISTEATCVTSCLFAATIARDRRRGRATSCHANASISQRSNQTQPLVGYMPYVALAKPAATSVTHNMVHERMGWEIWELAQKENVRSPSKLLPPWAKAITGDQTTPVK